MSRMFDNLQRELRNLKMPLSIPVQIELDDNGYIDRCCPSEDCGTRFKLLFEHWDNKIRDEVVFCVLCRYEANCTNWNTPEQSEYHRALANAHIQKTIGNALRRDARSFNSKQSKSNFVNVSMSYRPNRLPVAISASATTVMTQEFQCVECNCRYSSIGTAYFCPTCGYNNVVETFSKSIETVQNTLQAIPAIRQVLTETQDENLAENSVRHILENSLTKVVATFQKYAEMCFCKLPNSDQFNLRRNLFQSLEQSNTIWQNATSTGYIDILSDAEYQTLNMYFQQRHLLEHQDGIVDQEYIDRANDARFTIGQRLVVSESNVSVLASIVEKLSLGISKLI